jgi:hypothetical protein
VLSAVMLVEHEVPNNDSCLSHTGLRPLSSIETLMVASVLVILF